MSLDIAVAWFFAWLGAALALYCINVAPAVIGPAVFRGVRYVYANVRNAGRLGRLFVSRMGARRFAGHR